MDADVDRLVREQRLVEAAELAASRGDPATASQLFERACDFKRAGRAALAAGAPARALPLALEGKDDETAAAALPAVAADEAAAEHLAFHLERRGDHLWSARLLEAIGRAVLAARAYERAGEGMRAATLLEGAGDVVSAARVLETLARREPGRAAVHVALGSLLFRYGKTDAAVRALQRVKAGAPERRAALTLLLPALDRLGLPAARVEAARELDALGGPTDVGTPSPRPVALRSRVFGRYELVREVASSPSARVLECFDGVRNERVAVKIFAGHDQRGAGRDAYARFEREVKVLGALDHPNIVPLRDYVPEGPALVLAWMSGGTLEQRLAGEPVTPARAVEISEAVLSALGEAHRLGIVHRDIKPANVLFDDAGVTRLADFGVAHLGDLSATATAGVIGTLGYMSPEQREGRPASVRSDVYGVGAMLWEMLTGQRPRADDGGDDDDARRVRPSAVHRDLDARHDAIVLRMLATVSSDRPEDAFVARRDLAALPWPDTIERAAVSLRPETPKSERPARGRLVPTGTPGVLRDRVLERDVVLLPLDTRSLTRAAAFARADHPALQTVLRVDREGGAIWLARPHGERVRGKLAPAQLRVLREALDRLHDAGAAHGAVDLDHVLVDAVGDVVLTFADAPASTATSDLDHLALARLG
jgi:serine/threonine-protein kinase